MDTYSSNGDTEAIEIGHQCPKCGLECVMVMDRSEDGSWGIWVVPPQCQDCGDTIDYMAVYRTALRFHKILACDNCGMVQARHGLCDDCLCQCCDGDVADCKCHIEIRGRKEELISDERGTVYGYGECGYCTTHERFVEVCDWLARYRAGKGES